MLRRLLLTVCGFTALASLGLAMIDLSMKHSGYIERVWMAAFFASQAIATIIAFAKPSDRLLRALTLPGSVVIAYMGSRVLAATAHNKDIEGYVLLVALALVLQALLTLMSLILPNASSGHAVVRPHNIRFRLFG